ncbi:MAG: endonuclease/exonuclease/phosphatase family protein [Acidobacteriota bacterium]
MTRHEEWIEKLAGFDTLSALQASEFFIRHREQIQSYFRTPQFHFYHGAAPRLSSFLRIAQWNIEKGKRFNRILDHFQNNEILKWADVIVLNEADYGMIRSCNRHVARELAEHLGMHMVFGPAHFELTKGTADDLEVAGRNRESIQGNAILSRYPITDAVLVPLPVSFEPYEFEEKRFGARSCLWGRIEFKHARLWVGSVHLELRNTPRCRASQVKHILDNLPDEEGSACILGGDLNTNGFARGTAWRTVKSALRILYRSPEQLKTQLLHPEKGREPLFEIARLKGFLWEHLNSNVETARTAIDALEESDRLPGFLTRFVRQRLQPYHGYLCFKLDWFLGRHVHPLQDMQRRDVSGVPSRSPGCVEGVNYGPDRLSDHLPIYADVDLC